MFRVEKLSFCPAFFIGQCPVLTHRGYLHWTDCNITGCPETFYTSDEIYNCKFM